MAEKRRGRRRRRREELDDRPLAEDPDDWTVESDDRLRKAGAPQPLGDLLEGLVGQHGWAQRLRGVTVFDRWEQLVGPQLARKCEPVRLAGGRLVVRAATQAWATQVRYLVPTLRRRADEVLEPGLIAHVDVIVGPLEGTHADGDDRTG